MNFKHLSHLLLIAAAAGSACFPHPFVMWFLIVNLLTLVFYGVDKRAACHSTSRVPEFTLLLLGFAGGWIGAIVGQQFFRHKTKKQPFKTWFAISVIVNLVVVASVSWLMKDLFL